MIAKTGVLHSVPARDIELNICRRLYEAWDLRPAHLPRIIRHGRPSCRQGMGGLVATKGMPAMHAEVSPGEAGSPSSFSRNIPRDMIEGTPSNTRRRTYLRSRELQANGLGGPSSNQGNSKQMGLEDRAQINGTPSKWARRTELKSEELQAKDEENQEQEDCNTEDR